MSALGVGGVNDEYYLLYLSFVYLFLSCESVFTSVSLFVSVLSFCKIIYLILYHDTFF